MTAQVDQPALDERVAPGDRLRLAVLSDFDGPHARAWLRWFIDRGHDVHAISFYAPREPVAGAVMHALRRRDDVPADAHPSARSREGGSMGDRSRRLVRALPPGVARLAHGARYYAAGLRRVLRRIDPDVFQAHYLVEHAFYGALTGVRPFVATAWGSDVLVEPQRDAISNMIARWTVGRADLVTSNNAYMAQRIGALGALPSKVDVITLGADRFDMGMADQSVNRTIDDPRRGPVIISTRAHEPLYNIGEVIEAYRLVLARRPSARLVVAHGGSKTEELQQAAADLIDATFIGFLDRAAFREALAYSEIFVSVPTSDATSVALLQAMAAGAFPIVSALPSQRELIADGVNGFLVPPHRPDVLALRIEQALADPLLRRSAAEHNRRLVEERGLNEVNMAKLERRFYALAGKPLPGTR